jgi:hypothetical protein
MQTKSKPTLKRENSRSRSSATCSAQIEALYKAVQKYVESGGGKLVVIGGIAIQEWPTDNPMVFHAVVRRTATKPK